MIALAFGALMAMALSSLMIWLVLSDRLLLLYATLFSLQALYVAYLSGQGFEWPVLEWGAPVMSYTWNVTAALSGATACLFVREIAELRHYSPRVYAIFGWMAITFVVLAFANLAQHVGLGHVVAAIGNLVFLGAAVFTLVVAFLACTGVLNRRSLVERLETACLRARARGLPIALLFIDLDHFKEINDTRGHQAGDACLRAVVGPIPAELRQSDVIGRYGGEEFVVILSSADIAAAGPIAERIRNRVAEVRVEGFGEPIQVTCSIGVATSDTLGVWASTSSPARMRPFMTQKGPVGTGFKSPGHCPPDTSPRYYADLRAGLEAHPAHDMRPRMRNNFLA